MKLAVFLPNWIGDAVMATPALRALRSHFAEAEIVGVMRPYISEVLAGLDLLDRTLFHDPRGSRREHRGRPFLSRLRRERFDVVVLLPNSLRTGWLAWLSGAPRRIGLARDGRGWLLSNPLPAKPKSEPHPVLDEYLRVAAHAGCRTNSRKMELATTWHDEQQWKHFCTKQGSLLQEKGVVCLNPGGAFGSAKHWPVDHFADLAHRIARDLARTVLVLCGPSERDEARKIVQQAGHPHVVSLASRPASIGLTKAAVKHAELLVTTDSGPRHFAPPFDVPVITLFGPTHIAWSETFAPKAVHLQLELDCGPCQKRTCPLGHHRCMRDLTVDTVYREVNKILADRRTGRKVG